MNTSWKNDENTFKASGNFGLGISITMALYKRLDALAEENGWKCSEGTLEDEGGVSYTLAPQTLENATLNDANALVDKIKSEFKELSDERLDIKVIPYARWALTLLRVTFH